MGEVRVLRKWLLMLIAAAPTGASAGGDFTYNDWVRSSDEWRRGFAFGVAEHLMVVVVPTEAPEYKSTYAYKICLAGTTDVRIAQLIESYLARHPESHNLPMVGVAMQAIHEVCAPLLPDTGK